MTLASEIDAARETLMRAVRAAGVLQLEGAATASVAAKGGEGETDVVTNVDRACEAAVVDLIHRRHPSHAILAEEGTRSGGATGPRWILDPLDGTKNYVHGLPRFSCSLALQWDGVTLLGAVYNPTLDELFVAQQGAGATLNGAPIRVSTTAELSSALVGSATTVRRRYEPRWFDRLAQLAKTTQALRVAGCASLDLCDVARGRLDAYLEEGLEPWDTAAGALLVREAGGVVSTFKGEPHDIQGAETLASNGPIGTAIQDVLQAVGGS